MLTIRKMIVEALEMDSLDLREIARRFRIREKEALEHLQHVARSVGPGRFSMEPPSCNECGFVFRKRRRLNTPGRCPLCKSEAIRPPHFQIIR